MTKESGVGLFVCFRRDMASKHPILVKKKPTRGVGSSIRWVPSYERVTITSVSSKHTFELPIYWDLPKMCIISQNLNS